MKLSEFLNEYLIYIGPVVFWRETTIKALDLVLIKLFETPNE